MTDIAELGLSVRSDSVVSATDRLRRLENQAARTEGMVGKLAGAALKLVAAYATWRVAEAFVMKFVHSTIEAERAQQKLETVIRSTGGAAGFTADELSKMAVGLQRVTTFGDEAIKNGQALLLTFTKIGREAFPQALEAAMNVSTAMGTDLQSAILQVGKALNDPILGMTALSRTGIQFTETQKKVVKALVETNDIAGAQKIILAELETQFGDSARAARGTLGGALKALEEAFGDLFEANGPEADKLRRNVEKLIDTITDPSFISGVQNVGIAMFEVFNGTLQVISDIIREVSAFFNQRFDKRLVSFYDTGSMDAAEKRVGDLLSRGRGHMATENNFGSMEDFFKPFQASGIGEGAGSLNNLLVTMGLYKPPRGGGSGISEAAEKAAKAYADIIRSSREFVAEQRLEAQAIGMTEEAANRLRHEQEMLNQAANDNIKLTAGQREEIAGLAAEMAAAEEATRALEEAYDFTKDVFKGFFQDIRQGLGEGKSLWESFASAGVNALNKIADKAMDMALDGIFDMLFGAFTGALGGGFGSLGNGIGRGAGGFGNILSFMRSANGNVFQSYGLHNYANQVVNRPTVFPFAHGIGLMGEAGPEAIMPLKRGPDGRLGVSAANTNNTPMINITNHMQVMPGATEADGAAFARGVAKELRRQLPDAIQAYNRNPMRRAS